jgi:hypothetical protein
MLVRCDCCNNKYERYADGILCPLCNTVSDLSTPVISSDPPPIPSVFESPGKTLKLTTKSNVKAEEAFIHALTYLNSQTAYNRIEFRVGKTYCVVAKLKEKL